MAIRLDSQYYVPRTKKELIERIRKLAPGKYPLKVFKGVEKKKLYRIWHEEIRKVRGTKKPDSYS